MKLHYSYCGHIATDINHIVLEESELKAGLKALDENLSQVSRVTLEFPDCKVYIYHEKCSGYKNATLKYFEANESDEAMRFACRKSKGFKRIQRYSGLYKRIMLILSN